MKWNHLLLIGIIGVSSSFLYGSRTTFNRDFSAKFKAPTAPEQTVVQPQETAISTPVVENTPENEKTPVTLAPTPKEIVAINKEPAIETVAPANVEVAKNEVTPTAKSNEISTEPMNLLATLRMKAPKDLGTEVVAYVQGIYPNQSIQMLPIMFLGFWGYPDFDGVSTTDPVSVFFLGDKLSESNWVACAKIADESPLWSTFSLQKLQTQKLNGWTFVAKNRQILDQITTSKQYRDLLDIARTELKNDFQLNCLKPVISNALSQYETLTLQNLLQLGSLSNNMQGLSLISLFLNFANQIQEIQMSADFDGDQLHSEIALTAAEGSDLAYLFNVPFNQISVEKIASFIPQNGIEVSIGRYPPEATKQILQNVLDAFFVYGAQTLEDVAEQDVYNFIDVVCQSIDGSMTKGIYIENGQEVATRDLFSGNVTPEELTQWVTFAFTKLAPVFVNSFLELPPDSEINISSSVNRRAFTYKGYSVIKAGINLEGVSLMVNGASTNWQSSKEYYFCTFLGMFGITNTERAMKDLIDDVQRGSLQEASIASSMPLNDGMSWRMHLDLVKLMQTQQASSSAILAVEPIDLILNLGNNQARFDFDVRNSTIGQMVDLINRNLPAEAVPVNQEN